MPEIVTRLANQSLNILGQATQPSTGQPPPPNPVTSFLMLLLPMAAVWYFLILRPQGAQNKERANIMASIKKYDRVCTIGGIIVPFTNVKDDELTLKVDESNNTKITCQRSAIARVIHSDGAAADAPPAKK